MANLAKNKKAFHDFIVTDTYEAGISLQGTEVKSCRSHSISFVDSHAKVVKGEVLLCNVHISPYDKGNRNNHDPKRVRKLLLHKSEIRKLSTATQAKGLTLVPLSFYLKKGRIKVSLGVCKGKRISDKRETLKKQQVQKDLRRVLSRKT